MCICPSTGPLAPVARFSYSKPPGEGGLVCLAARSTSSLEEHLLLLLFSLSLEVNLRFVLVALFLFMFLLWRKHTGERKWLCNKRPAHVLACSLTCRLAKLTFILSLMRETLFGLLSLFQFHKKRNGYWYDTIFSQPTWVSSCYKHNSLTNKRSSWLRKQRKRFFYSVFYIS